MRFVPIVNFHVRGKIRGEKLGFFFAKKQGGKSSARFEQLAFCSAKQGGFRK